MAFAGLLARRGRGAAAGDEPQALGRGDRGPPPRLRRGRDGHAGPTSTRRWPSASGRWSSASRASASPRPTARPSACSPTSRPGCACTTGPSSCARCSTSSRWASTRPTRSSTRPSAAGSRSCAPDVNASDVGCTVDAPTAAVRIGLGYVLGVRGDEVAALVAAREAGGPFRVARRPRRARGRRPPGARAARLVGRLRRAGGGGRRAGPVARWAPPAPAAGGWRGGDAARAAARAARGARARAARAPGTR